MNNTSVSDTIDMTYSRDVFLLSVTVTPDLWIIHTGAVLTYLVFSANVVIISAFLRKDFISPSTIILAALAFSDTITAICLFLPKHFGFLFHQLEYGIDYNVSFKIVSRYPYCGFIFWMDSVLISAFHIISLILTTLLALQKTAVIGWPIRSKRFVTKRTSTVCVLITFVLPIATFITYGFMFHFHEKEGFCEISFQSWVFEYYFQYIFFLSSMVYILATFLLTICSIYISAKLTCCSSSIQQTITAHVRNIHRRSAAIVVLVVFIFFVSEFLSILCIFQITFTKSDTLCKTSLYDYSDLTLGVGFAANYIVYLSMSRQLRKLLTRHVQCCLPSIKQKNNPLESSHSMNKSDTFHDRY